MKKNTGILIIWLIIQSSASYGQNLVLNGSFEQYFKCPTSYVTYYRQQYVRDWDSPNPGTPDYFNACSKKCGVPNNWVGYAEAPQGKAYMGIIACLYQSDPNQIAYREYLRTRLAAPLIKGQKYYASFQVKLAQSCNISCNGLGMFFAKNDMSTRAKHNYPVTADIRYNNNELIKKTEAWTRICGSFRAEGGEEYLIIGNFLSNQEMDYFLFDENLIKTDNISPMAYYYIDNVEVWPFDSTLHHACNTTPEPKKDMVFEKQLPDKGILVLDNLYFKTDESEILPESFEELNHLARELKNDPKLHISIYGHTDNTGTAEYNQKLSETRAKAVKYYLLERGISQFRIKTKGFGSSQPRSKNTTAEGKSRNRRVEIEINKRP